MNSIPAVNFTEGKL